MRMNRFLAIPGKISAGLVQLAMLRSGDTDKILNGVVEWVLVPMVYVASLRDRAIMEFPDRNMQRSNPRHLVTTVRPEVPSQMLVLGLRPTMEPDAVEYDRLGSRLCLVNSWHDTSVSPGVSNDRPTHPRS